MNTRGEQHTAGNIQVDRSLAGDLALWSGENHLLASESALPLEEREENARRLAACWNACRGLSTDDLEMVAERFPSDDAARLRYLADLAESEARR